MFEITLTDAEVRQAVDCGTRRREYNKRHIRDKRVARDADSLTVDINGAKAERAVVKMTGYPWHAFEEKFWETPKPERPADVGPLEVKTNNRKFKVNMLCFQADNIDMRPHVLAIPERDNCYSIAGWRFGFECRRAEYWMKDWTRPCYAVPEGRTYSLTSLRAWCVSAGYSDWTREAE